MVSINVSIRGGWTDGYVINRRSRRGRKMLSRCSLERHNEKFNFVTMFYLASVVCDGSWFSFLSPVIYFRLLWKQKNAAAAQRKELWRFSASPVDVLNSIFLSRKDSFSLSRYKASDWGQRGMQRWKDQLSCVERFSPFNDFNYELFSDEFSIHHGRSRVQLWMARDGKICKLIHSTMEILFVRWKIGGETLNLIRFLSSFSHNSEEDVN